MKQLECLREFGELCTPHISIDKPHTPMVLFGCKCVDWVIELPTYPILCDTKSREDQRSEAGIWK